MAKKASKSKRNPHTPPKRRRLYIFPYVVMALLIIGIPLAIYQIYVSNVNRNIADLTEAIQSHDIEFLENRTDRLDTILDVFEKSYSEDEGKQEEFYNSNFKNLTINVVDEEKKNRGKEVTLEIINVNYIDVYDKLDDSEDDEKIHTDYMAALADPNQERNTRQAKIYMPRKFNGYNFYESRDFVSGLLGGALEYADGGDTSTSNKPADAMDDAINN